MNVARSLAIVKRKNPNQGFTLIEIIITFVLMGIMATMFSTLFTNAFTESAQPSKTLKQDVDLTIVMEQLIANWNNIGSSILQSDLETFKATVGSEGSTSTLDSIQYYVIDNHFVSYDSSGAESTSASTTDYLKVTIRPNSSTNQQPLTYLFTVR